MVIKGGSRGGAGELANHLQRTDTNERMEVREVRGVVIGSVTGALREMEAVSAGSRSRKPFYHASINTPSNEALTEAQKTTTIDRLEEELGLTGQPRVVVEHVKAGRTHLHVAWCRIDGETLTAIPDSHNFRSHEVVARELEREFGHKRVQGVHHERGGVERPQRRPSLAETRQAERSGVTPEEAKAQLRSLWGGADNGKSFVSALGDAGWTLAQGDKRGFVALDPAGEARAINKDITGLTAAKVRERLADIDAGQLPSVDEARARQRAATSQCRPDAEVLPAMPAPTIESEQPIKALKSPQADPTSSKAANAQLFPNGDSSAQPPAPPHETPGLGDRKGTATPSKAIQRALHAPEIAPDALKPRENDADRPVDASRLRLAIDKARERLEALGNRLEAAFERVRQMIDRRPKAEAKPREETQERDLRERDVPKPEVGASEARAKPKPAPALPAGPPNEKEKAEQLRQLLNQYRRPAGRSFGDREL